MRSFGVPFLICSSSVVCAAPLSGTVVIEELKMEVVYREYVKLSGESVDGDSSDKKANGFNRKIPPLPFLARENSHLIYLFARTYPATLKVLAADKAYSSFRYLLEHEIEALEQLHAHAPKTYTRFLSGYLNPDRKAASIDELPDFESAGFPAIEQDLSLTDGTAKFLGYQGDTITLGRYKPGEAEGSHFKIEQCLQTGD